MSALPEGFIPHDGGPCPCDGWCDVMFADGRIVKNERGWTWGAGSTDWWRNEHAERRNAIIAYRPA